MNSLNGNLSSPLYQQLYDEIKSKIISKEYEVGQQIPSEQQLSDLYKISRITVRNGIQKLCDDGILIKKHGKGTFVALPRYIEEYATEGSFTKSCLKSGKKPTTVVISKACHKSQKEKLSRLGLTEEQKVIVISRLRLIDGVPCILEEDCFVEDFSFMLNENLEETPIMEIIRQHTGKKASVFNDNFSITRANNEQATLLKVAIGTPLLMVDQTVVGDNDEIIYFNRQLINSAVYCFTVSSGCH